MRPWIDYILSNSSIYADFIDWAEDVELKYSEKIANAMTNDELTAEQKTEQARTLSAEYNVYRTLRKRLQREQNERIAQLNYTEKMKGE